MPAGDLRYNAAKALEKKYQMQVNSLAERPDMSFDHPEYKAAAEKLTSIGRTIDDYEAENRVTDEQGKLIKPPVTRLPVVSDPTQDKSGFNYHFEPSVREAQEALRSNPQLFRQLDPLGEWSGIAEPERQEDITDPGSGMVVGQNTVPSKTWLDNLTDSDSLYDRYSDYVWKQRINEARQRGVGIQRYKDIELGDEPVDFLAGGAEKGFQKIVEPAASGMADVLTMGTADTVGRRTNEGLNEANRRFGLPEVPYESAQEIQNRNPVASTVGGLAGYALPGNIINSATELAVKGLGYGSRGALGKAGISALTGSVGNTIEGGIMDTVHGMNAGQSFGDAAGAAVQNAPLNFVAGGLGGGLFDAAGQAAGNMRESFRRGTTMADLKTLEDAGGRTSVIEGVVAPPEVEGFVRQSKRPRAVGSPAAYAAEEVAPHIETNLEKQAAEAQKRIEGEKEQYFNHPAYRDREVSGTPAIAGLVDMAKQGWASGPVTGAPRNVNPGQVQQLGKIIREFTDVPQVVRREDAEAFAKEWDGIVIDGELGNQLYGLDERTAAPPGYSIVSVPIKLNARKLTDLEARIDAELNMGAARGNNEDPVWTSFNRSVKETRDQFPYYVDDQGNLVAPPDWQDPNAPSSSPEGGGPVYEGEFVESSRPGTDLERRGPSSSEPPSGGAAPAAPGGGPELGGGGGGALPRGQVSPEEATPLSLLAGNRLAMPAESTRSAKTFRIMVIENGQPRPVAGMRAASSPEEAASMVDTLNSYGTDEFVAEPIDSAPPALKPSESRGPLERMLDEGLEDAPALPVSEIEDAAFRQQADRDKIAKGWQDNEAPTKEWYEDIVAPGRTPRSNEVKRIMDLTEQQRAVEESLGELNNVDRRLGPIPEQQKEAMLIGLISKKLGRQVTKEELVRAGLLAGGVAAAVTAEEPESGAAMAGIGGLLAALPKGAVSIKTKAKLGILAKIQIQELLDSPDMLDDVLSVVKADSGIPSAEVDVIEKSLREFVDLAKTDDASSALPGHDVSDKHWALQEIGFEKSKSKRKDSGIYKPDAPIGKSFLLGQRFKGTDGEATELVESSKTSLPRPPVEELEKSSGSRSVWNRPEMEKLARVSKSAYEKLTGAERRAVDGWTGSSGAIRHEMRTGTVHEYHEPRSADFESAIEKMTVLNPTKHGPLYRRFHADDREIAELLSKDVFEVGAHMSSGYFSNGTFGPHELRIRKADQAGALIGVNPAETEMVIPKGGRFRVVDRFYEKSRNGFVFELEEIPLTEKNLLRDVGYLTLPTLAGAAADEATGGEGEGTAGGAAGAMAIGMGRRRGKGGRSKPPGGPSSIMDDLKPKGPRQLEAELDDGTKVQGFSALRRKQHLAQTQLETSKRRVGATGEKTIRDRVIGFNQGDNKLHDDALLDEAKKAGKEEELWRAAAASVYPGLKDKAWFRGGEGMLNRTTNAVGLHTDPIMELLSGGQRNPFLRSPPGAMEDMLREFLNITGGRTGARHGDDFRRIYEALHGDQREEEQQ